MGGGQTLKIGTEVPTIERLIWLFIFFHFRKVCRVPSVMRTFALDQNTEIMRIGCDKDAVKYFILITVHQLEVLTDEFVIIKRMVNEAFEQILFEDNRFLDDKLVRRDQFVRGRFPNEICFHLEISQAE